MECCCNCAFCLPILRLRRGRVLRGIEDGQVSVLPEARVSVCARVCVCDNFRISGSPSLSSSRGHPPNCNRVPYRPISFGIPFSLFRVRSSVDLSTAANHKDVAPASSLITALQRLLGQGCCYAKRRPHSADVCASNYHVMWWCR